MNINRFYRKFYDDDYFKGMVLRYKIDNNLIEILQVHFGARFCKVRWYVDDYKEFVSVDALKLEFTLVSYKL